MRTVPATITDGFANKYSAFWCVKVEGSGSNTFYWTSTSKNRTGHTFTLEWTAGVAVTPDSGMIASRDMVTGEEYDGIGAMESGVDVSAGGNVASVADLEIQILNQENFHDTIIQGVINIENRPITVYFGFIPDGASQTVVISTGMLKRWAGVVDEVMDYDYQTFILRCTDGSFQRHKTIPTKVVNLTDYPNAPQTNVGKSIPICYGVFGNADTAVMDGERATETFSGGAPAIRVHDQNNTYVVADHAISGFIQFLLFVENGLYGTLTTPTTVTDSTGTFSWDSTSTTTAIKARIWQQPKKRGSLMSAVMTHAAACDGSATSHEAPQINNSDSHFYLVLDNPLGIGQLSSDAKTLYVSFVVISDTNGNVIIRVYDGTNYTDSAAFTAANSNSTQSVAFTIATLEDFIDYQFGIEGTTGNLMTAEVANMYVEYYIFPQNIGRQTLVRINPPIIPQSYRIKMLPMGR